MMKHKNTIALLAALCLAASSWPVVPMKASTQPQNPQPLPIIGAQAARAEAAPLAPQSLAAEAAIVIDADTGEVLFQKNADQRKAPASTTKLMTLLLAVEHGGLDRTVTVPDSAGKAPAGSSLVPVYPGEKMPMRDLVYGLMIKSGNDAANAIGTLVSGSVASFVDDMNERAQAMGLKNTRFVNPHGFPTDGHYSSARDLAKLARAVLNNSACRKVLTTNRYKMHSTSRRDVLTLNRDYAILNEDSPYYYAPAFGGKTGYSVSSGQCFVCMAEKDGHTLISVVLNAAQTKPEKWIDSKKLLEYGFSKLGA